MKKILITGANGYIGAHLREYFQNLGVTVLSATRDGSGDVMMDFSAPQQIAHMRIAGIDAVLHTVSPSEKTIKDKPYQALADTALGTKAILDFCVNNQIKRFIYFSSFHTLGLQSGEINESTSPKPVSDYGFFHLIAEQTIAYYSNAYNMHGTSIRLSNVYGLPATNGTITRWHLTPFSLCREAVINRKIVLHTSGEQERNFVHISNVFSCVQYALDNPHIALLHCYGEETYSIYNFAKCICQCVGNDVVIERPQAASPANAEYLHYYSLFFKPQKTSLINYIDEMCEYIKKLQ